MRRYIAVSAVFFFVFVSPVFAADEGKSPEAPAAAPAAQVFTFHVDGAEIGWIGQALNELPKKIADPIINKLNAQLAPQIAKTAPPAAAPAAPVEKK
jgi:hypothetical protein